MPLSRRDLLKTGGALGLGVTFSGALSPLLAQPAVAARRAGYGPLVDDPGGLLDLPPGFRYRVVTRAGDPLLDGTGLVPGRHDGSASFPGARGQVHLINNHEQGAIAPFPTVATPSLTYDPGAKGGTTTVIVDRHGVVVDQYVSLAGTYNNCAGGVTPWGTWLTCEETEQRADATKGITRDHGYVFEVDPCNRTRNANPAPLTALGRFPHEAVCVDPRRGHLYLTEDASGPNGLLYRFTPAAQPNRRESLRGGGQLEAMYVPGLPDLSAVTEIGASYPVTWKAVPDPLATTTSTRKQFDVVTATAGQAFGSVVTPGPGGPVTRSRKLEGAWWGNGRAYIVASYARLSDGSVAEHDGQVWSYDPGSSTLELRVRFGVNPDVTSDHPDGPDNITVSPYGGLVLAEDGEGVQHLLGVDPDGDTFLIARNRLNDSEFTGPNFSPDGRVLYANIQDPGIVFAITGPWRRRRGLRG